MIGCSISGLCSKDYCCPYNGKEINMIVLVNDNGCEAVISTFGLTLISFVIPIGKDSFQDVVIGQPSIKRIIENQDPYMGSIVGRYANRICGGQFELIGKRYYLPVNNGDNNLHTGPTGFHSTIWDIIEKESSRAVFRSISPDGDCGFPGELTTTVTFSLDSENKLHMDFHATTTKSTIVSITNHAYFNLGSHSTSIEEHKLLINSDFFIPVSKSMIPTGEIRSVTNTPFDFRKMEVIGSRISNDDEQLINGSGYDHSFALKKNYHFEYSHAATLKSEETGVSLSVYTTLPGLQLYSGNFLNGFPGKKSSIINRRGGVCMEAGFFPDTPNNAHFPSCVLHPNQVYQHRISFCPKME